MEINEWKLRAIKALQSSELYRDDEEFWLNSLVDELLQAKDIVNNTESLSDELFEILNTEIDALIGGKPLAQIIGYTYFYSYKINVFPNVLIPRPDSEILVSEVLKLVPHLKSRKAKSNVPLRMLEIGVGSGALSIAIAQELLREGIDNFEIQASDISIDALQAANYNIERHGLSDKIKLVEADLWPEDILKKDFVPDVIFSNPPYISNIELQETDLLDFEPVSALLAEENGLAIYRRIFNEANTILETDAFVLVEHGSTQDEDIRTIAKSSGFKSLGFANDLADRPRVSKFIYKD